MEYEKLREKFYLKLIEFGKHEFKIHLLTYLVVNSFLAFLNLYYSSNTIWFIYPLVFWGLGLLTHYLSIEYKAKKYIVLLDSAKEEIQ